MTHERKYLSILCTKAFQTHTTWSSSIQPVFDYGNTLVYSALGVLSIGI